MRIIAKKTLREYWEKEPQAEEPLKSWFDEASNATWKSPAELKAQFGNASILTGKRVVFNIHGNAYRLIVDVVYQLQIIFVVRVLTHREYDKTDARTIDYVKTDPNRKTIRNRAR